jgi:dihydroflavonol-4-reductase
MKVFVTGATGYIGRRLVDRLLAAGDEVVALTRQKAPDLPSAVRPVTGELLDPASYGRAGEGCELVYHLAALITFDQRRRAALIRANAEGTACLLDAARGWGARRSVFVSSACTLGISFDAGRILDESDDASGPVAAANPYLASKQQAEAEAMRRAGRQEIVIVNPTTVYGPGDRSLNSGTLIAKVARLPVVPVPPGGSNVVDVDDVVDGLLLAAAAGRPGARYVLGGENLPFAAIFRTIADVVGRRPLRLPLPACSRLPVMWAARLTQTAFGGRFLTPQIVGDLYGFKYYSSRRAEDELGYRPRYAFRETVQRAWTYYREAGLIG